MAKKKQASTPTVQQARDDAVVRLREQAEDVVDKIHGTLYARGEIQIEERPLTLEPVLRALIDALSGVS